MTLEAVPHNEWFLYNQNSGWAGGARAPSRGEIFDRAGRPAATTMQEGLIRPRRSPRRAE